MGYRELILDNWLEAFVSKRSYQVKKAAWPANIDLGKGRVCPVRKDWVGEGFFYIVDTRNGILPTIANLYGWETRLKHTANTTRSYLIDIACLLDLVEKKYNLEKRFAALDILTHREVDDLIGGLAWKQTGGDFEKASLATLARRLGTVKDFLRFGYGRYHDRVKDDKKFLAIEKKINRIALWIEKATPSSNKIQDETKSPTALSNEQLAVLRFGICPGAKHNPFSNKLNGALQYRNLVLISLLIESGMRPAELCMLERGDLFQESQSIWVSRWMPDSLEAHDNQSITHRKRAKFPRKVTVGHKTRGRMIKLQKHVLDMLQIYIDQHRGKILKAHGKRRSRYLFLSDKDCGPITVNGISSIVKTVSAAFPAIGYLTTYSFRHTSVSVSSAALRKALDHVDALHRDQQIQEFLTTKYGWSTDSDMPDHYGRDDLNALLAELSEQSIKENSTYSALPLIDRKKRDAANDAT